MLESSKTNLVNLFKQNTTIQMEPGARIEYNMNSILENITVRTSSTDSNYISQIKDENGRSVSGITVNPFKKLFPVDSVVRANRPQVGGIKYYISPKGTKTTDSSGKEVFQIDSDSEYTARTNYETLKVYQYPDTIARVYFAGDSNEYKYFVTPIGLGLDVTVNYNQKIVSVKEAYSDGQKIYFRTNLSHGFTSGLIVTVTGMGSLNVSSATISSIPEVDLFVVHSNVASTKVVASGTATLSVATKNAFTNKIVATFEKFHHVPNSCIITYTKTDGTEVNLGPYNPVNGKIVLHYVAKSTNVWQQSSDDIYGINDGIEFKYANPIEIKSLRIRAANDVDKIIGLIELSPRWVKDISSDIITMEIQKEASANSEDILPIGKVSSNSLSMQIVRYQDDLGSQESIQVVGYNKNDSAINPSLIYMIKGAEIKTFFKVFHSNATSMPGIYDVIKQGNYYIDSYIIGPRGSTSISALDGARTLMTTIAPERLFESYSATGVMTALLDSVGFTNYKFNLKLSEQTTLGVPVTEDNSVPVINYFWSDGKSSVWDYIQQICSDTQMNAFFDENNILQISSRNYIYDNSKTKSFLYTYDNDGTTLPNIVSFAKKEVPAKNQVKIIYSSPFYTNLIGSSSMLYTAPTTFLAAGSLLEDMTETSPVEPAALSIDIIQPTEFSNIQSPFAFQGYVLINSEIIEYDAVQYKLVNKNKQGTEKVEYVWIESESDISKYIVLAEQPDYTGNTAAGATFAPSNKLRIKKRGALGTKITSHLSTKRAFEEGKWKAYKATWQ